MFSNLYYGVICVFHGRPGIANRGTAEVQQWQKKYRLLHGKCARTVFMHKLFAYQKTNE